MLPCSMSSTSLGVLVLAGRHRADRESGGEAVIVFDLLAAVLAVAAIVYLVVALVKPERF